MKSVDVWRLWVDAEAMQMRVMLLLLSGDERLRAVAVEMLDR